MSVTVNNAALHIGVQISVRVLAFTTFARIPRAGIAGSYDDFIFNLLRNHQTVFHSVSVILQMRRLRFREVK